MHGASQRKATAEQCSKMAKPLQSNFDKMVGMDMKDAARNLSGELGMSGAATSLSDIRALLPDDDESDAEPALKSKSKTADKSEAEAEEGDGADDPNDEGNPGTGKGRGKSNIKWFDRDRAVNRAHKSLQQALTKTQEAAQVEVRRLEDILRDVDTLHGQEKKDMQGDIMIATSRKRCMEILFEKQEAMDEYIKSFTDSGAGSGVSSKSDPVRALGRALPSRLYRDLKVFDEWKDMVERILDCDSADSIEQAKTACNDVKGPITDLISASKVSHFRCHQGGESSTGCTESQAGS